MKEAAPPHFSTPSALWWVTVFAVGFMLAQAQLGSISSLPEDVIVNTWAFATAGTDPSTPEEGELTAGHLAAFYDALDGSGGIFSGWFVGLTIFVYDLDPATTGAVGSPIHVEDFALGGSGNGLPQEVALCLSFRNNSQVGVAPGRRRGRVYLGPISTGIMVGGTDPQPAVAAMDDIADAAVQLGVDLAGDGIGWGIWSRMDDAVRPVDQMWVDNEWDTIRSRGNRATLRVTRP